MARAPERIIFVDGDENTRLFVKLVYEKLEEKNEKLVMVTCSSGEEMLLRLRIIAPDLVIIGQKLDGMDGLDTIRAMRDLPEGKDIPVIFLTDKSNLSMIHDYRRIGVEGIIYKPLEASFLPELISGIWNSLQGNSCMERREPAEEKSCSTSI